MTWSTPERAWAYARELAEDALAVRLGDRWWYLDDEDRSQRIAEWLEGWVVEAADGGWYVARPGLSAFVGLDREEAIQAALSDSRFPRPWDRCLIVFQAADVVWDDEDGAGSPDVGRVWPAGEYEVVLRA